MHYLLRYISPYSGSIKYTLAGTNLIDARAMAQDLVDTHQPYCTEVELFCLNEGTDTRDLTFENVESHITPLEIYKNREWHYILDGNMD